MPTGSVILHTSPKAPLLGRQYGTGRFLFKPRTSSHLFVLGANAHRFPPPNVSYRLRLANLNLKLFEHLQQKQIYLQLVDEEVILQKVIFDEMLRLGVQR